MLHLEMYGHHKSSTKLFRSPLLQLSLVNRKSTVFCIEQLANLGLPRNSTTQPPLPPNFLRFCVGFVALCFQEMGKPVDEMFSEFSEAGPIPIGSMGRLYIYLHENHKNQPFPASSKWPFWFPKWRSLNPWKGHLKPPKRSLGRTWSCW